MSSPGVPSMSRVAGPWYIRPLSPGFGRMETAAGGKARRNATTACAASWVAATRSTSIALQASGRGQGRPTFGPPSASVLPHAIAAPALQMVGGVGSAVKLARILPLEATRAALLPGLIGVLVHAATVFLGSRRRLGAVSAFSGWRLTPDRPFPRLFCTGSSKSRKGRGAGGAPLPCSSGSGRPLRDRVLDHDFTRT